MIDRSSRLTDFSRNHGSSPRFGERSDCPWTDDKWSRVKEKSAISATAPTWVGRMINRSTGHCIHLVVWWEKEENCCQKCSQITCLLQSIAIKMHKLIDKVDNQNLGHPLKMDRIHKFFSQTWTTNLMWSPFRRLDLWRDVCSDEQLFMSWHATSTSRPDRPSSF